MPSRFSHQLPLFFAFLAALSPFAVSAQESSLQADLGRHFTRVQIADVDVSKRTITLPSGDSGVRIVLTPNDIRAANYRAEETGERGRVAADLSRPETYIGKVDGDKNAAARFSMRSGRLTGMFERGVERYFVEPASAYSARAGRSEYVVYRVGDLRQDHPLSCGSHLVDKVEKMSDYAAANSSSPAAMRRIDLALDADFDYVNIFGGVQGTANEILGILNVVDGLYETELRLSLAVVYQHFWTTPDPYGGAFPEQIVRSFQNHWNANFPASSIPRDTAHLFSGKGAIQGQGWAFISVVCNNPNFSYGGSGYVGFASGQHLITSHELAHNLGANHVDSGQSCANTLMNGALTGATPLTFCQYSRNEIANHIAVNGGCIGNAVSAAYDFDGDQRSDLSIFRPGPGQWWYARSSDGASRAEHFGTSTDRIVPGDYSGDGKTDIAVWRPATGQWLVLRSEDSSFYAFPFGSNGDTPVPADFDGDGKSDAAVYRQANSQWFVLRSSDAGVAISSFGIANDRPVNADYDGDGRSDLAVYRPSSGEWWIARSSDGPVVFQFGNSNDRTVQGDYTGDGRADVAVWRPSNGNWFILRSEDSSFFGFPYGASGDMPSPGDYDGDGRFDAAVFRPSGGTWFVNRTSGGSLIQQFGIAGDLPVPNAFVR